MPSPTSAVLRPEHPLPVSLSSLIVALGMSVHAGADLVPSVSVTGATVGTVDVVPGDLFVALAGAKTHGAAFADRAVSAGAIAVLTDASGAELAAERLAAASLTVPLLILPDPRLSLGEVAARIYGSDRAGGPRLFGITGTNGKTSTAYLLDGILRQLGLVTGMSSTTERRIADLAVVSRLTTPEATELHALLGRMREVGVEAVTLEISAQAITQHRVDGLVVDVAGFTNLSHDHLDDYGDMENYFQAKLALFQPDRARRGVASLDSAWGTRVAAEAGIPVTTISAHPAAGAAVAQDADDADWRLEITSESATSTGFSLSHRDGRRLSTIVPLVGRHMASNAAVALVMLIEAGWTVDQLADALAETGIDAYLPGRIELLSGAEGPAVYLDFGHSADAFEQTLAALRPFTPGRLIIVFGASGDRDASKRPEMARVAVEGSDVVIVTDHHVRTEDPASIRAALLEGARATDAAHPLHEVVPPEAAIRFAIELAEPGDAILWAGPGHLAYREVGTEKVPFSARQHARDALSAAGWPVP